MSFSFPPILMWAAPFFVLAIAFEWYFVKRERFSGTYQLREAFASMSMGLGNLVTDLLFGVISLACLFFFWQFRFFDLGASWPIIILALFAQDFVYYWKHRLAHKVRWFWSAHVVHHSSGHYNLATALRQPWNNHFTGHVILSAPLVLIGFHPLLIAFVASLNLLYQFWIHTETIDKMPKWFEAVFNTPSHHRVHHGINPQYLDMNFAGIFIIWDKLFGTFVAEQDGVKITYGVVTPIGTHNPIKIAFSEWFQLFKDFARRDLTIKQRLAYIFAAPGYSHDGSRETSDEIKAAYYARRSEASSDEDH